MIKSKNVKNKLSFLQMMIILGKREAISKDGSIKHLYHKKEIFFV